jgi:predicted DNA-binding protein (UPF0251 family)
MPVQFQITDDKVHVLLNQGEIGPRPLADFFLYAGYFCVDEVHEIVDTRLHRLSRLTSSEIGRAIGRSRQTVDMYISDLRATVVFDLELKIFRLHQLGIPQDRIAKRLEVIQQRISRHLLKMPGLAKRVNTDLSKGFTVP